jgi:hypothetical protein
MTLMKMTPSGEVPMSADEERVFLADQAALTGTRQANALRGAARAALEANDRVAARCVKAGVPYPAEWLTYDEALRVIAASGTGQLPQKPPYPANT